MTEDRIFEEAVEAIKTGQGPRAKDLLTRLLRTDQSNWEYWLYMSTVVESRKERIFCLENVLKYDPGNETATRGLVLVGAMPPDESLTPVRPVKERDWVLEQLYEASGEQIQELQKTKTKLPLAQGIGLAMAGIMAVILVVIGIVGNPFYKDTRPPGSGYSGGAQSTIGPTPTYLGTGAPYYESLPSPTYLGPTPLAFFLEATFTPTPRYVNTPHPSSEAFNAGMRAFHNENYEGAIMFFEQVVDAEPDALDARYYLGMSYLYSGEAQAAKIQFQNIIREDDTFAPAYVGLAKASLALNPDYGAGGDLEKAISIDPDYLEAHLARAEFRLNKRLYRQVIEEDAPNALEINPDCGLAYYYLAAAYLGIYEYEDALEAAQKANELDPTIIDNYYVLGYALIKTGSPEEAMAPLQTYITYVEDDIYAVYLLGQAQVAAGYYELGLENLEKAQEVRKDLNEIQYHMGLAYLGMLDYESAIEHLEIAIKKFPQWFELRVALAEAYYMTEEYLKANETINYVSGAVTDEQKAALYYWRGLSFEKLGELDLAERDFRALLALPYEAVPEEWRRIVTEHLGSLGSEPPPPTDAGPTRVPSATPRPTP